MGAKARAPTSSRPAAATVRAAAPSQPSMATGRKSGDDAAGERAIRVRKSAWRRRRSRRPPPRPPGARPAPSRGSRGALPGRARARWPRGPRRTRRCRGGPGHRPDETDDSVGAPPRGRGRGPTPGTPRWGPGRRPGPRGHPADDIAGDRWVPQPTSRTRWPGFRARRSRYSCRAATSSGDWPRGSSMPKAGSPARVASRPRIAPSKPAEAFVHPARLATSSIGLGLLGD